MKSNTNLLHGPTNTFNAIAMSLPATASMTLFSILYSVKVKRNYVEPILLGDAICRQLGINSITATCAGWVGHVAIGALFCRLYVSIWKHTRWEQLKNGAVLGAASGVVGVLVWKTVFGMQKRKPANEKEYYAQLVAAHIIFGIVAKKAYKARLGTCITNHKSL